LALSESFNFKVLITIWCNFEFTFDFTGAKVLTSSGLMTHMLWESFQVPLQVVFSNFAGLLQAGLLLGSWQIKLFGICVVNWCKDAHSIHFKVLEQPGVTRENLGSLLARLWQVELIT